MKVTFETEEYGKIECNISADDSGPNKAYFFKEDYISDIDKGGCFTNWWGTKFRIHVPSGFFGGIKEASLEVWTPKTIARATPE